MGTVRDAIAAAPDGDRAALAAVIDLAFALAPDATEGMSYGMPALRVDDRPYVAVAATRTHLAIYPFSAAVVEAVRDDLADYSVSKGTVRFRGAHPLPQRIVERMLVARLAELGR